MRKRPIREELLDEGIDESFPASDPVSVSISRLTPAGMSSGLVHPDGAVRSWSYFATGALVGLAVGLAVEACRRSRR